VILCKTISDLTRVLNAKKASNQTIGFVPTMGALHAGHLSLVKQAKLKSDCVVCSIFVNPTQFNQESDLKNYPITIENDLKLLAESNCDVVFVPTISEVYPDGLKKSQAAVLGSITMLFEGAYRPGHFDGVHTILKRLFDIVKPNLVYFGQKDFQQCLLVKKLIAYYSLPIEFFMGEIVRESDGLAMSSRNVRLTAEERKVATEIFKALSIIKQNWHKNTAANLIAIARKQLEMHPLIKIEYLNCVDSDNLLETVDKENVVCLIAVNCGAIRLIDNVLLP
jgi:pantoate--beta-alanine ligase